MERNRAGVGNDPYNRAPKPTQFISLHRMNNTAGRNVIGRARIKAAERPKVGMDTQRKQATAGLKIRNELEESTSAVRLALYASLIISLLISSRPLPSPLFLAFVG